MKKNAFRLQIQIFCLTLQRLIAKYILSYIKYG